MRAILSRRLPMEDPIGERLDPGFERHPPVVIPKEARVGETSPQNPFIAGDNCLPAIFRDIVGDEQKARGRCIVGPQAGEILLMRAHRRCQHLRRKHHEVVIDCAHQNNRKLDETRNLGEQHRVRLKGKTLGRDGRFEPAADHLGTAIPVEDNMGLPQALDIIGSASDANLARRQKAVSAGASTDRYTVERQWQDFAVE
jgi:hypothetical protein